jgi:glycosyltransferase involved in cell wall biosynthesis
MSTAIKVSVCIPLYRVEAYIERCARSLFEQTLQDGIEFIFVDDASPDASVARLEAVLEDYPQRKAQVKILRHATNQGLVAARQTALKHAQGEYIIHCDSDDWVDRNYYEDMYLAASSARAEIAYSAYYQDDGAQKCIHTPILETTSPRELLQAMLGNNRHWNVVAKLVHRNLALSPTLVSRKEVCFGEDLMLSSQMVAQATRVAYCGTACYHYFCKNESSYTRTFSRASLDQLMTAIATLEAVLPEGISFCACKGEVLFKALFYHLMTAKEFRAYARGIRGKILRTASLSKVKRFLLFFAFIAYTPATWGCRLLRTLR